MDEIIGRRSMRMVMIADRRQKGDDDNKCDLYCYKPPSPFNEFSNDHCIEKLLNNTNKYILPHQMTNQWLKIRIMLI